MSLVERRQTRSRASSASIGALDYTASSLDRAIAADVLLRHIFLPPAREVKGMEYSAYYRFAEKHSGGDIIDVYRCSHCDSCFSLTDISGKGVEAALHAGLVKYGIRAFSTIEKSPAQLLTSLNEYYCENDSFDGAESFASVVYGRYDTANREFVYANAGQEGVILITPSGEMSILPPTGAVVGILRGDEAMYEEQSFTVEPGSVLVAASDGITEARRDGEWFGIERFAECVRAMRELPMQDVACNTVRAAIRFAGNKVYDDMAVLAIRFT